MHLGWQVELESLRCNIFESLSKAWTTYHQIQIGGNQGTMTTFPRGLRTSQPTESVYPKEFWPRSSDPEAGLSGWRILAKFVSDITGHI